MRVASPFAAALLCVVAACGPKEPAAAPPPPTSASPPAPGPAAQVVNATILTNGCQELGKNNARLAERAMYQLVEGCTSVPGGSVQFEATLQPGGRVDIAVPHGQPDVVPVCILKHALQHKVPLSKPCRLEVKIAQTSVPVAQAPASAGPTTSTLPAAAAGSDAGAR
jgi:hypothetical protein